MDKPRLICTTFEMGAQDGWGVAIGKWRVAVPIKEDATPADLAESLRELAVLVEKYPERMA